MINLSPILSSVAPPGHCSRGGLIRFMQHYIWTREILKEDTLSPLHRKDSRSLLLRQIPVCPEANLPRSSQKVPRNLAASAWSMSCRGRFWVTLKIGKARDPTIERRGPLPRFRALIWSWVVLFNRIGSLKIGESPLTEVAEVREIYHPRVSF